MRARSITITVLAAGALTLSACSTSTPAAPTSSADSPASTTTLDAAETALGPVLVQGGRTVYIFTKDTKDAGTSACSGECAAAWPPVLDSPEFARSTGVSGTVGHLTRVDGTTQLTVDGWPIYTFAADDAAGDVTGQGVKGSWFTLRPDGSVNRQPLATSSPGY